MLFHDVINLLSFVIVSIGGGGCFRRFKWGETHNKTKQWEFFFSLCWLWTITPEAERMFRLYLPPLSLSMVGKRRKGGAEGRSSLSWYCITVCCRRRKKIINKRRTESEQSTALSAECVVCQRMLAPGLNQLSQTEVYWEHLTSPWLGHSLRIRWLSNSSSRTAWWKLHSSTRTAAP